MAMDNYSTFEIFVLRALVILLRHIAGIRMDRYWWKGESIDLMNEIKEDIE